ncbi:MAG: hypothetical protein ACHP9T_16065 [Caulobacterales bacterium]|jgi:DNA-binding transcriptional ArsR family regulator
MADVGRDEIDAARRVMALLGDPLRRTIVERLSLRPQAVNSRFLELIGAAKGDVYHRLRSLRRAELVRPERHCTYRVEVKVLSALRKYADLLLIAASASGGRRHDA